MKEGKKLFLTVKVRSDLLPAEARNPQNTSPLSVTLFLELKPWRGREQLLREKQPDAAERLTLRVYSATSWRGDPGWVTKPAGASDLHGCSGSNLLHGVLWRAANETRRVELPYCIDTCVYVCVCSLSDYKAEHTVTSSEDKLCLPPTNLAWTPQKCETRRG